jgi:uncharacterized damage-inducible protein DinB
MKRVEPPQVASERDALTGWLDYHRAELLAKLDGLTDEQADRRIVPSLTTLHGLLRHLTKVEYAWFVRYIEASDEPGPFGWPERQDGDFLLDDGATVEQDAARFVAAVERSREIFARVELDDVRTHPRFGDIDVRWIMVHMLEEYAQHNGHADILRELIDGVTQS